MAFPSTLDSFDNPAGTSLVSDVDHAAQHSNVNNAVELIEANIGTNSGTNILFNFVAGQFPVRNTGGGATGTLVQTLVAGSHANTFIGTSQITGGTITGVLFGTQQITGGTIANVLIGTSQITGGSITNAELIGTSQITGGTLTSVVGTGNVLNKIITSTRDLSAITGTVGYTGAGFTPTSAVALVSVDGQQGFSIGMADSTRAGFNVGRQANGSSSISATLVAIEPTTPGALQTGTVVSYTSDGVIIGWTKVGSPTGVASIYIMCIK